MMANILERSSELANSVHLQMLAMLPGFIFSPLFLQDLMHYLFGCHQTLSLTPKGAGMERQSTDPGGVVSISAPEHEGKLCDNWVTKQMLPEFTHHESAFHKLLKANASANPLQGCIIEV